MTTPSSPTVRLPPDPTCRLIVERMPFGCLQARILYQDGEPADWVHLAVNPAYEAMTGLKDAAGRTASELYPGLHEAHPDLLRACHRVARGGPPETLEAFELAPDRRFSLTVFNAGVDEFIVTFGHGTADRVAEADPLRERKGQDETARLLRERTLILETANVGISMVVDRNQVWVNPWIEKTFGYTSDEIIGGSSRRFHTNEEDFDRLGREAYPRLARGETYESVEQLRTKDGRPLWIHYNGRAIDPTDLGQGILWVLDDITQKKQVQDALAQSEARFREIFAGSPSGMSVTRAADGVFLQINSAWTRLFGWSREEVLGRSLRDLNIYTSAEDLAHRVGGDQRQGSVSDQPLLARCKDGTLKHLRLGLSAITLDGEPCFLAVLVDHTALHEAQEALVKSNQDLEQRVAAELARRMAQERMLIHQARLAAMGEMIGNIAHQWRQPLGSLSILLGNLKDARRFNELTDEFLNESFVTGDQLIKKMSSTITDFTTFFRPNKEPVPFSLREQAEQAVQLVAPMLGRHHVEVEFEGGVEVRALGFPNEFSQVVLNLLTNALEAIQAAGALTGRIRVQLEAEGGQAILRFSDNGRGIKVTPVERIFEPYWTDKPSGTGLGLYMSRMILEQSMAGTLTARNLEGGAEFRVALPSLESNHGNP